MDWFFTSHFVANNYYTAIDKIKILIIKDIYVRPKIKGDIIF